MENWHILHVEDNPDYRFITRMVVADNLFFKKSVDYFEAETLETAKSILDESDIDLILLDVILPGADRAGLDFVQYIRKTLNNRLIRIIVLSGETFGVSHEEMLEDYDVHMVIRKGSETATGNHLRDRIREQLKELSRQKTLVSTLPS